MADFIAEAIAAGKKKAEEILDGRRAAQVRRATALQGHTQAMTMRIQTLTAGLVSASEIQTAGFLAAVGDSWFDYPFHDVLKLLEDGYGYNIESTAHKGDPLEKIAYQGGQIDGFTRKLEKIKARGAVPKAVLLSGGGDDVAGNEFGMLLNNAFSPIPGWNQDVVDGVLKDRIARAYVSLFSSLTRACQEYFKQTVPILVHGYDYPVPDGRGFLGGWPFPGPWLDPGFREKNFKFEDPNDLSQRVAMMKDVMDQLNAMLKSVTSDPALSYVHYIDLRGTLSNDLKDDAYKEWWANELHPTEQGFEKVTQKFEAELRALP
jgi:hypothetical protein